MKTFTALFVGLVFILLTRVEAAEKQDETRRVHEAAIADPFDDAALAAYRKTLPRDGDRYIVEGDVLLAETELRPYLAAKQASTAPADGRELVVNRHAGRLDYWVDRADRELTYAVARDTFKTEEQYRLVVENMRKAGEEWNAACPECGIRFQHLADKDSNPSHDHVRMVVRYHDVRGRYIAAAFFPHEAPAERWVNVDPSYFSPALNFDRVGVFRHELGHTLGYRHEHTRGVPGCWFEDQEWKPLTPYDPHSVMHYFCGNAGSFDLTISETDKAGHRALYASTTSGEIPPPTGLVAPGAGDDMRAAYRAAVADPFDSAKVAAWRKLLPRFEDLYVVEGDIRLAESELVAWLAAKSAAPTVARSAELLVNRHGGRDDFWADPAQRDISFAVDRKSFANQTQYDLVVRNAVAAAREWTNACPACGIRLRHVQDHDTAPSHDNVTFIVRGVDAKGAFVAAAFFPHEGTARRYLDVDGSYFTTNFDKVGVLRHEFGHVLGYRHEHIRGEAGCWPEAGEWRPLTPYDPKSVMHYFCNGQGSMRLEITAEDRRGHSRLYAPESAGTCQRPPAGREGLLIVRLQSGDPAADAARALSALAKAGALPTDEYQIQKDDNLCRIFKLPLDGCPEQLIDTARALNDGRKVMPLMEGDTLRVPAKNLRFCPYAYGRYFDSSVERERSRANEISKVWSKQVIEQKQQRGLQGVTLRGFELAVPLHSAEARERGAEALSNLRSTNVLYEVVTPEFPRKKARFALPDFLFSATAYLNGQPAAGEADYYDVLRSERPAGCTPTCTGSDCPSVVIADTEIANHPEIVPMLVRRDEALQPLPPAAAPAGLQNCPKTIFDPDRHHGTHMAGIIASQANSLGFEGLAPFLHIEHEAWANGTLESDLADRLWRRRDKGLRGVYLFASRFEYSRNAVFGDELLVNGDDARFSASLAARSIRDLEQLWVVAAGNRDANLGPLDIRRNSAWAPMNLGSLKNVVVVTACDPCDDTHAKLLSLANYSTDRLVHLAAPGMPIAGLATANRCAEAGGTSQAAAFVAGIAGAMRSCFPDAYQSPQDIKTRLEITARPVFAPEEDAKLTAGVVDGELALLDPKQSWLLAEDGAGAAPYRSAIPKHWCSRELRFSDLDGGPVVLETKNINRIVRYRRDKELNAWIVFTRRLGADVKQDSRGFLLRHTGPVRSPAGALIQLEGHATALTSPQFDDLVLSAPLAAVGSCT